VQEKPGRKREKRAVVILADRGAGTNASVVIDPYNDEAVLVFR
jgi:hypothetical protein